MFSYRCSISLQTLAVKTIQSSLFLDLQGLAFALKFPYSFTFMSAELASASLAFIPIIAAQYWYYQVIPHIKKLIDLKKCIKRLGPVLLTGVEESRVKKHSVHLPSMFSHALLWKRAVSEFKHDRKGSHVRGYNSMWGKE